METSAGGGAFLPADNRFPPQGVFVIIGRNGECEASCTDERDLGGGRRGGVVFAQHEIAILKYDFAAHGLLGSCIFAVFA